MASETHHPTEIDGEPILFVAELSDRWLAMRHCTCGGAICAAGMGVGGLLFYPFYAIFGAAARKHEKDSFYLYLTPTALHCRRKIFGCGCCCHSTDYKVIPLDKIQDLQLVSDCCGDCCGWSEGQGQPWQLHVQTAGTAGGPDGGSSAELSVYCIKNMTEFRSRVLTAKRELRDGSSSSGGAASASAAAGKTAPGATIVAPSGSAEAVLGRLEALLAEGVSLYRARASSSSA